MGESDISQRLTTALRQLDCIVFKVHGHTMQQPGWPDFYLAFPGWNGWIETKGAATLMRPIQKTVIGRLKRVGVSVYVLRFVTERHFALEDEEGTMITEFRFNRWHEGATLLLHVLLKAEGKCVMENKGLQSSE